MTNHALDLPTLPSSSSEELYLRSLNGSPMVYNRRKNRVYELGGSSVSFPTFKPPPRILTPSVSTDHNFYRPLSFNEPPLLVERLDSVIIDTYDESYYKEQTDEFIRDVEEKYFPPPVPCFKRRSKPDFNSMSMEEFDLYMDSLMDCSLNPTKHYTISTDVYVPNSTVSVPTIPRSVLREKLNSLRVYLSFLASLSFGSALAYFFCFYLASYSSYLAVGFGFTAIFQLRGLESYCLKHYSYQGQWSSARFYLFGKLHIINRFYVSMVAVSYNAFHYTTLFLLLYIYLCYLWEHRSFFLKQFCVCFCVATIVSAYRAGWNGFKAPSLFREAVVETCYVPNSVLTPGVGLLKPVDDTEEQDVDDLPNLSFPSSRFNFQNITLDVTNVVKRFIDFVKEKPLSFGVITTCIAASFYSLPPTTNRSLSSYCSILGTRVLVIAVPFVAMLDFNDINLGFDCDLCKYGNTLKSSIQKAISSPSKISTLAQSARASLDQIALRLISIDPNDAVATCGQLFHELMSDKNVDNCVRAVTFAYLATAVSKFWPRDRPDITSSSFDSVVRQIISGLSSDTTISTLIATITVSIASMVYKSVIGRAIPSDVREVRRISNLVVSNEFLEMTVKYRDSGVLYQLSKDHNIVYKGNHIADVTIFLEYLCFEKNNVLKYRYLRGCEQEVRSTVSILNNHIETIQRATIVLRGPGPQIVTLFGGAGIGKSTALVRIIVTLTTHIIKIMNDSAKLSHYLPWASEATLSFNGGVPPTLNEAEKYIKTESFSTDFNQNKAGDIAIIIEDPMCQSLNYSDQSTKFCQYLMALIDNSMASVQPDLDSKDSFSIAPTLPAQVVGPDGMRNYKSSGFAMINTNTTRGHLRELAVDEECFNATMRRMYGSGPSEIIGFEMRINPHECLREGPKPLVRGGSKPKIALDNVTELANQLFINNFVPDVNPLRVYKVHREGDHTYKVYLYQMYPLFLPEVNGLGDSFPTVQGHGQQPVFDQFQRNIGNEGWCLNSYLNGDEYLNHMCHIYAKRFFGNINMEYRALHLKPSNSFEELSVDPELDGSSYVVNSTDNDVLCEVVPTSFDDNTPTFVLLVLVVLARIALSYVEFLLPCSSSYLTTLLLNVLYVNAVYRSMPTRVFVSVCSYYKPILISLVCCLVLFSLEIVAFTVAVFHVVAVTSGSDTHVVESLHPCPNVSYGLASYFYCCKFDEEPVSYVFFRDNNFFLTLSGNFGLPCLSKKRHFNMIALFSALLVCAVTLNCIKYSMWNDRNHVFFFIYVFNVCFQDIITCRRLKVNLYTAAHAVREPERTWYEALVHMYTTCADAKLVVFALVLSSAVLVYNVVFPRKQSKQYTANSTWNEHFTIPTLVAPNKDYDNERANIKRVTTESFIRVDLRFSQHGWVVNYATQGAGCFFMPTHCFVGRSLMKGGVIDWRTPSMPVEIRVTYGSSSFDLDPENLTIREVGVDTLMIQCDNMVNSAPIMDLDIGKCPVIYPVVPDFLSFGPTDPVHIEFLQEHSPFPVNVRSSYEDVRRSIKELWDHPIKRRDYFSFLSRVLLVRHLNEHRGLKIGHDSVWLYNIITQGRLEVIGLNEVVLSRLDDQDEFQYNHMTSTKLSVASPSVKGQTVWVKDDSKESKIARGTTPRVTHGAPVICGIPVVWSGHVIGMETGSKIEPNGSIDHMIVRLGFSTKMYTETFEESHRATFGTDIRTDCRHDPHLWINHAPAGPRYSHTLRIVGDRSKYVSQNGNFVHNGTLEILTNIVSTVTGRTFNCTERKSDKTHFREACTNAASRYTALDTGMKLPKCKDFVKTRMVSDWVCIADDFFGSKDLQLGEQDFLEFIKPADFSKGVIGDDSVTSLQLPNSTGMPAYPGPLRDHVILDEVGCITTCTEGSPLMQNCLDYYKSMLKPKAGRMLVTRLFAKAEKHMVDTTSLNPEELAEVKLGKNCRLIQNVPTTAAVSIRIAFFFMLKFFSDFNAIWMSCYAMPPYALASICVHFTPGQKYTAASVDVSKMDTSIGGDVSNHVMSFLRTQLQHMSDRYDERLSSNGYDTYGAMLPLFDNCVYALQHWWSINDGYATYISYGNISGSPITTHFNILVGVFVLHNVAISILTILGLSDEEAWKYVKQHVHFSVYGDDMRVVVAEPNCHKLKSRLSCFTAGYLVDKITKFTGFKITHDLPGKFLCRTLISDRLMLVPASLAKAFGCGLGPKEHLGSRSSIVDYVSTLIFTTLIELSASPSMYVDFTNRLLDCDDSIVQACLENLVIRAFSAPRGKMFFGADPSMVRALISVDSPYECVKLAELNRTRVLIGKVPLLSQRRVWLVSDAQHETQWTTNKKFLEVDGSFIPASRVLVDSDKLRALYDKSGYSDRDFSENSLSARNDWLREQHNSTFSSAGLTSNMVSKHLNKSRASGDQDLPRRLSAPKGLKSLSPIFFTLTMIISLLLSNNALAATESTCGYFPASTANFSTEEGCMPQENACLEDDEQQLSVRIPTSMDAGFSQGGATDAMLGDFLRRPVQISQFTWDVNTSLDATFDPWDLYLSDPKVTQKIDNYNLIRCDLHIKLVINGNAFYYGDLLTSYLPTPDGDPYVGLSGLLYYTQRPHFISTPTKSQGGSMVLPFFQPYNWYSIPKAEWKNAGELRLTSFMPLRNANAATAPITVTIFAWAENVQLSIPTEKTAGSMVPSSTENPSVISDTATAVADGLENLTPVLGAPASVASTVARGLGGVAKAFGFDRVNPQTVHTVVENRFFSNTASTTLSEHVAKLTIDPKQELSTSAATVGIAEEDGLVIADQCKQEAMLFQFPITTSDSAGTQLCACRVNPALATTTPSITSGRAERGRIINQIPLCHASQPFSYWKGSIKFRFRLMSSTFHKLRLKVVWDPNPGGSGTATPALNTVYSRVIDMSTTEEFTQVVTWGQEKPYLRVPNVVTSTRNNSSGYPNLPWHVGPDSGVTATTYDSLTDNGMLYVYVLNELVVPNPVAVGNPIMNVFVSSDDMHFNVLTTEHINDAAFFPKPGDSYAPAATYENPLDPITENVMVDIGGDIESSDLRTFFGQQPLSWRALFKRAYALPSTYTSGTANSTNTTTYLAEFVANLCTFPPYAGYNPGASTTVGLPDGSNTPYEFAYTTILNWVAPMFCAWRGGMRVKSISLAAFNARTSSTGYGSLASNQYNYSVERTSPTNSYGAGTDFDISTADFESKFADFNRNTFDGMMVTPGAEQPALEVEAPFLSNRRFNDPRFKVTNNSDPTGPNPFGLGAVDQGGYIYLKQKILGMCTGVGTTSITCGTNNFGSTAPDFSLFWRISTYPIYDRQLQAIN